MPAHLDSELLRTFVAIADRGSFSRAGEAVGRTQSAVSLQMKRLEDLAGCRLFRREARGVSLTVDGERLLVNARRIMRLMDRAAGELAGTPIGGSLRVGIPAGYGARTLAAVLTRFAAGCPDVEVTLDCTPGFTLEQTLAAGGLDLAVFLTDRADVDGEALVHEPVVWATSARHDTLACDPLPVALYEPGCWWRDRAIQTLDEQGIQYRVACTSASAAGISAAIVSGLAIGVLGQWTVPDGARVLTEADGFPGFPGSTIMLHRRPGAASPAVDYMAEVIREVFCCSPPRAAAA